MKSFQTKAMGKVVDMLLHTLCQPFTVGYPVSRTVTKDGNIDKLKAASEKKFSRSCNSDGTISALVIFFILVSISFTMTLAGNIAEERQSRRVHNWQFNWCLNLYMVVGCAVIWFFSMYDSYCPFMACYILDIHAPDATELEMQNEVVNSAPAMEESDVEEEESESEYDQFKTVIQSYIPLIGIAIFFSLGSFLDILKLMCHISCFDIYQFCHLEYYFFPAMAFNVIRITFHGSLMTFCFKFHHKKLVKSCVTSYSLVVILTGIISLWLDTMISESATTFSWKETPPNCSYTANLNSSIIMSNSTIIKTQACLHEDTQLFTKFAEFVQFLYPLHIEFSLMTSEILVHLFFETESGQKYKREDDTKSDVVHNDVFGKKPETDGIQCTQRKTNVMETGSGAPKLPSESNSYDYVGGHSVTSDTNEQQITISGHFKPLITDLKLRKTVLFFIVLNIIYISLGFLTNLDNISPHHYKWRFTFEAFKLVYCAFLNLVCFVGYSATERTVVQFYNFTGLEFLLILMSIGFNVLAILELIAVIEIMLGSHIPGMPTDYPDYFLQIALAARSLNLVQFFLQMPYMFLISRVQFLCPKSCELSKIIVLTLVVSNLALWGTDSFVEVNNYAVHPIPSYYYGPDNWKVLSRLFVPFYFFLRFNSFLILLASYFKL